MIATTHVSRKLKTNDHGYVMALGNYTLDSSDSLPIDIQVKVGTDWALYVDNGPRNNGGQSYRDMLPQAVLMIWPSASKMIKGLASTTWRTENNVLMYGVAGQYTVGGVLNIVQNTDDVEEADNV